MPCDICFSILHGCGGGGSDISLIWHNDEERGRWAPCLSSQCAHFTFLYEGQCARFNSLLIHPKQKNYDTDLISHRLHGNLDVISKAGLYINMFWCVNDSYLPKVLELVLQIVSTCNCDTADWLQCNLLGQLRPSKSVPLKVLLFATDMLWSPQTYNFFFFVSKRNPFCSQKTKVWFQWKSRSEISRELSCCRKTSVETWAPLTAWQEFISKVMT